MHSPRLFRLAHEAVNVVATFVPGEGWRMTFGARRGDEQWDEATRRDYSHLTTPELMDVICAETRRTLGGGDD